MADRDKAVLVPSRLPQELTDNCLSEESDLLKLPGLISVPP
jgi:hypothetical protein